MIHANSTRKGIFFSNRSPIDREDRVPRVSFHIARCPGHCQKEDEVLRIIPVCIRHSRKKTWSSRADFSINTVRATDSRSRVVYLCPLPLPLDMTSLLIQARGKFGPFQTRFSFLGTHRRDYTYACNALAVSSYCYVDPLSPLICAILETTSRTTRGLCSSSVFSCFYCSR